MCRRTLRTARYAPKFAALTRSTFTRPGTSFFGILLYESNFLSRRRRRSLIEHEGAAAMTWPMP